MTTGNRSRTALVAARIALLAGVSAAALLALGTATALPASAQAPVIPNGVVNPPYTAGDLYTQNTHSLDGADLTNIPVPGLGVLNATGSSVLETQGDGIGGLGVPVAAGTTGVVQSNGAPVVRTYADDTGYAASTAMGAAVFAAHPTYFVGSSFVAGDAALITGTDTVATLASQCNSAAACTAVDPYKVDAATSYKWMEAVYRNNPNYTTSTGLWTTLTTAAYDGTYKGTFATGDVVLTSTGVVATAATQCTLVAPCTFAAPQAADATLTTGKLTNPALITQQQGSGLWHRGDQPGRDRFDAELRWRRGVCQQRRPIHSYWPGWPVFL